MLKPFLSAFIVTLIILLTSCEPPTQEKNILSLPSDFELNYNSVNRQLSWTENADFNYIIEHSQDSTSPTFTELLTTTHATHTVNSNESGFFRIRPCLQASPITLCSEQTSNQLEVSQSRSLLIESNSLVWQAVEGANLYRIETASESGSTFSLLSQTQSTIVPLPETLPYAVRLYSCSATCNNDTTLIDELQLNTITIPENFVHYSENFDNSIPNTILNATATTNRQNTAQKAITFSGNAVYDIPNINFNQFAISLWFNTNSDSGIILERRIDNTSYWSIEFINRQLFIRLRNSGVNTDQQLLLGSIAIEVDNWYHLYFQYQSNYQNNAILRLAVDGKIFPITLTEQQKMRFDSAQGDLRVASTLGNTADSYFGAIDDISIFNVSFFDNSEINDLAAYDYLNSLYLELYQ